MPVVEFVVSSSTVDDRGDDDKRVVSLGKMTEYRASQPQNCSFNLD
jgi:hypothetical protein